MCIKRIEYEGKHVEITFSYKLLESPYKERQSSDLGGIKVFKLRNDPGEEKILCFRSNLLSLTCN